MTSPATSTASDPARTSRRGSTIALRCRCGAVRGALFHRSAAFCNRVICYCDDCQAFAHRLRRADLLDEHGGSDIVQVPRASLEFTHGHDRIAGLRLSPRGLYRWHARCCNTPMGNTVGTRIPLVGLVSAVFAVDG